MYSWRSRERSSRAARQNASRSEDGRAASRAAPFSPVLWPVAPGVRAWWFQRSASGPTPPRASAVSDSPPRRQGASGFVTGRRWRASWSRNRLAGPPLSGRERVADQREARATSRKGRATAPVTRSISWRTRRASALDPSRRKQAPSSETAEPSRDPENLRFSETTSDRRERVRSAATPGWSRARGLRRCLRRRCCRARARGLRRCLRCRNRERASTGSSTVAGYGCKIRKRRTQTRAYSFDWSTRRRTTPLFPPDWWTTETASWFRRAPSVVPS